MKTYAAVSKLTRTDADVFRDVAYPHILASFHYQEDVPDMIEDMGYRMESVLADSGAFTVWTKGATIDLDAYIAWCVPRQDTLPCFLAINLDVIPGSPSGAAPSMVERGRAMDQSIANADQMRDAGLRVMEVFHWHEPLDYLDELLERRRPGEVLGIGGLAGQGSITAKARFCDGVFRHVIDRYGKSEIPPLHGLGISHNSRLARSYPWWSIDSSAWVSGVAFGVVVNEKGRVTRVSDKRTSNRKLRQFYIARVLKGWVKDDIDLARIWETRNVAFLP